MRAMLTLLLTAAVSQAGPITTVGSTPEVPKKACECQCPCCKQEKPLAVQSEKRLPQVFEEREDKAPKKAEQFKAALEEIAPTINLPGYYLGDNNPNVGVNVGQSGLYGWNPATYYPGLMSLNTGLPWNGMPGWNPSFFTPGFLNTAVVQERPQTVLHRVCDPRNPDDICYDPAFALLDAADKRLFAFLDDEEEFAVAGMSQSLTALSSVGFGKTRGMLVSDQLLVAVNKTADNQLPIVFNAQPQIVPVATPEPATLVTFGLLGVSVFGYRRLRS